TPGEVTAAALLFLRTVAPIAALLFVMDDLQSALAALGRLVGVINRAPAVTGAAEAAGQPDQPGQAEPLPEGVLVRVADASFGYADGAPVLVGVSLSLRVGETLAVVGATGSGKSTLAALIAGVYRPGAGLVQRGVGEERIVTVAQEAHVFAATLRENLTLAAPAASDDVLRAALSRAGAEQAAAALPEGLDTPVGHGGHPLEAALAQHLALARVELADPAVVILDE
ncbi:ABC transporter ATP-binding protein, partial [Leucobacter sp. M11]|uniref:ABC transporter ATP-binding protein n=1 Tax=Leucobacter sp. M11 TaxID=2993565 RepID=UPI002D7E4DDD